MALSAIQIQALRFDNEPFIRSLTATLTAIPVPAVAIDGNEVIRWNWNNTNDIKGFYLSGNQNISLVSNTTGNLRNLSSVVFKLSSAITYDYRVENYSLFLETISASYLVPGTIGPTISSISTHVQTYDTFPKIEDPTLYVNYENTKFSNLFYRTTSNPFNFNLSAVVNPSLINPTNYILSSQKFEDWSNTRVIPASTGGAIISTLSSAPNYALAPDYTNTAQLLVPLTADFVGGGMTVPGFPSPIINGAKTITNFNNSISRRPGTYTSGNFSTLPLSSNYTVQETICAKPSDFLNKYNALFQINVAPTGAVSAVSAVYPGSNFSIGDTIIINNNFFEANPPASALPFTFQIESLYNTAHDKFQTLALQPDTYTYSVFVKQISSTGRYLYYRGFNQGDIIFDIQDNLTYNYGSWTNANVQFDTSSIFSVSVPVFNTNFISLTSGKGFYFNQPGYQGGGGSVYTVIPLTATNQFLIGGSFESYEASNGTVLSANNLLLLNSDGSIPTSNSWFTNNRGVKHHLNPNQARINTIAVSGDKIYIGGSFSRFISSNGVNNIEIPAYNIARLNLNGTLDTTFTTSICGDFQFIPSFQTTYVNTITFKRAVTSVNPNDRDKILVGGYFTSVNNLSTVSFIALTGNGGVASKQIFDTGTFTAFNNIGTCLDGAVLSVAVDEQLNRIYIGGAFARYRGAVSIVSFLALSGVGGAPLTATTGFSPNASFFDSDVSTITIDQNNKILVGGLFTTYDAQKSFTIARLLTTGKLDTSFQTTPVVGMFPYPNQGDTAKINSIQIEPITNKIYVGGFFYDAYFGEGYWQGRPDKHIIRLNPDGSKDTDFLSDVGVNLGNRYFNGTWPFYISAPQVWSIYLSSNKVFIGGEFSRYSNRQISYGLTTLNRDGTLFTQNVPGAEGWKRCSASFTLTQPATSEVYLGITTNTNSVSSPATFKNQILTWGSQINRGISNTRTPYISTLQTPRTLNLNVARINFNNLSPAFNVPLTSTVYSSLCSYNVPSPTLCSAQILVSAKDTFDSLYPWYSPHTFTTSITGIFVSRFLTADFIGFPTSFFDASARQFTELTFNTYTTSQGLSFYGEGHTQEIYLSAKNNTNIKSYSWNIQDQYTNYNVKSISLSDGTFSVNVSSRQGYYPSIPITLFVEESSNSLYNVLTSGPYYRYNDTTGILEPYPFFYNTKNLSGSENTNNNRYKQSIQVYSYVPPATSFSPGIPSGVFLPTTNFVQPYTAYLIVSLSGFDSRFINPCYNLYNTVWSWSTFTPNNTLSSWAQMALGQTFQKQWSASPVSPQGLVKQPTTCYASNIFWTLSTPKWVITQENPNTITRYNFTLQTYGNGSTPYTVSTFENTPIYIRAQQVVTCIISATPFDWQFGTQNTVLAESYSTIYSRGDFKIYTSNRYVPINSTVVFQNISQGFNNVREIQIDLNNGTTVRLLSSQVYNNFSGYYTQPGKKTITATIYYLPQISNEPVVETFTNIIEIVTDYDIIDSTRYLTNDSTLKLPHSNPPYIAPNEWVTEDNINSVFKKFYENIEYLNDRANAYKTAPTEYYGWLGTPFSFECPVWTWEDIECTSGNTTVTVGKEQYNKISWADLERIDSNFPQITADGKLADCGGWQQHECLRSKFSPDCTSKYGISWSWKARKQTASSTFTTWKNTKCDASFAKKWKYEPFTTYEGNIVTNNICLEGQWNINIPKLNDSYSDINCYGIFDRCTYTGIASKNNILFVALKNEIRALSSDYTATPISYTRLLDNVFSYNNIKNICVDSYGKLFVLDSDSNRVASYNVDISRYPAFEPSNIWGNYGDLRSKYGFNNPNDIHLDGKDYVWVTDTGNRCIKQYTNTGSWIQTITDETFANFEPISVAVDSQQNIHVLTTQTIRVYNTNGEFIFDYSFINQTNYTPIKITTNYNRELIYVITNTEVLKYFRNGVFVGYIVNNENCINNINGAFQDEFRNILITSNNNIIKFADLMKPVISNNSLPSTYWKLEDLYIHKNEYVQNWVYAKSFQRLWDNIEIFRGTLKYNNTICKGRAQTKYTKDKITVGQNEIVTSSVINRNIEYLWQNLATLFNYFDPTCKK